MSTIRDRRRYVTLILDRGINWAENLYLVGEGGTFALLQGLRLKGGREGAEADDKLRGRHFLHKFKWVLQIWALFGTALTLSDGIFTPGARIIYMRSFIRG